jgi:hypothetical protein
MLNIKSIPKKTLQQIPAKDFTQDYIYSTGLQSPVFVDKADGMLGLKLPEKCDLNYVSSIIGSNFVVKV